MKRFLFLVMCLFSVLAFSACGGETEKEVIADLNNFTITPVITEEVADETHSFAFSVFDEIQFVNPTDYKFGLNLLNNETGEEKLVCTFDMKSDDYWEPVNDDFTIVGTHADKILFYAFYGPGSNVAAIYSVNDNTLTEIGSNLKFNGYYEGNIDCSADYILSSEIRYDIESYSPIYWHDWDGNVINTVANGQFYFVDGTLYVIEKDDATSVYNIYTVNEVGDKGEKLCTIKGKDYNFVYIDDNRQLIYIGIAEDGGRTEDIMSLDALQDRDFTA